VAAVSCILVTGASRGLGAALALRFAAPGVGLRLVARDAAALAEVAAACRGKGAEVEVAARDVREAGPLAALLLRWDDARAFTCVIANAGVTGGTAPDGTPEDWASADRVLGVNLLGAVNSVAPLLPRLLGRGAGQVVLIASVAAFRGLPDSPAYCASKAGLWAWGESLRALLGPRGIRVTNVAPGFFATAMSRRFSGRHPGELALDEMARRIQRAIQAGRGRAIIPSHLGLALRLLELLPAPLADRAARLFRFHIM
jgi:short-subunit dehydrogenase